jgi:ligand-binding SRPBCC domain-containing protein
VSIHVLERSQRVEVPVEQAFDFYVDALNLEPMTPPWLHFEVTTPGELRLRQGTLLDYKLRLHGVPVRWQTRIETWEPPLRFVDTQRKGPYSLWEHTHLFEKDGETATSSTIASATQSRWGRSARSRISSSFAATSGGSSTTAGRPSPSALSSDSPSGAADLGASRESGLW